MFRHVLRRHTNPLWAWGPATEFRITLDEIDSRNAGGANGIPVMFLLGKYKASKQTQELLLDDYMDGFLFQLFREKWKKLRFVHYTTTSISVFYFVSLVATALAGRSSRGVGTVWTVTLLCALVLHVGETMRETIIYVRRYANANAKKKPMLDKVKSVLSKLRLHGNRTFAHFKLMSFALTIGALARRAVAPPPEVGGDDLAAMVLFVLSILVFAMFYLLRELFLLSPRLHKLATLRKAVNMIISTDVLSWVVLSGFYAGTLYTCLLLAHPVGVGDDGVLGGDFGRVAQRSSLSLLLLLLAGETHGDHEGVLGLDDEAPADGGELSAAVGYEAVWAVLYYLFILFTAILLLNLLIAMMTNTYETVQTEAKLKFRVEFAQRVLRYEIIAPHGVDTRCGEFDGDPKEIPEENRNYYYAFREVRKNIENQEPEGGATLFAEHGDELVDRLVKELPQRMAEAQRGATQTAERAPPPTAAPAPAAAATRTAAADRELAAKVDALMSKVESVEAAINKRPALPSVSYLDRAAAALPPAPLLPLPAVGNPPLPALPKIGSPADRR